MSTEKNRFSSYFHFIFLFFRLDNFANLFRRWTFIIIFDFLIFLDDLTLTGRSGSAHQCPSNFAKNCVIITTTPFDRLTIQVE